MATSVSRHEERALRKRGGLPGTGTSRRRAGLLLLAVSICVAAGLWQVGETRLKRSIDRGLLPPVQLRSVQGPEELAPVLATLYPPGPDRDVSTQALWTWLEARRRTGSLEHVWALEDATVAVSVLEKTPGLVELREQLEAARDRQGQKEAARLPQEVETSQGARTSLPTHLPLFTTRQLRQIKPGLAVRDPEAVWGSVTRSFLLFLLGSWLPLLVWTWRRREPDPWLLPLAAALSGLGMVLMVSLRDPLRDALLFSDFAIGVAGGGILMTLASLVDYQGLGLRRLTWVPLLLALLISGAVLAFGTGPGASDARVNLSLGGVTVQPVEAVKLLMVLFMAAYFSQRWELLRSLHLTSAVAPRLAFHLAIPRRQDVLPVAIGLLASVGFLFAQRDMGPALVLGMTFLGLYALARARLGLAIAGVLGLIGSCWLAYVLHFPGTVFRRMAMQLDPWTNLLAGGEQLALGLWAFASGGTWGTGLGWGETVRVPAAHTDFILAAVGEELGFVGLALTLTLYGLLLWRGMRIALEAESDYPFLLAAGLTGMLGVQLVLILSGVLGVMPLSGVTTPLLSYGKSSQWMVSLVLGMLLGLSAASQRVQVQRAARGEVSSAVRDSFSAPSRLLMAIGALILVGLLARIGMLQLVQADELMVRPLLAVQAGNEVGFVPNPRLKAIAESIPRGTLFDRRGLPLATSDRALIDAHHSQYVALGVDPDRACPDRTRRCYPLEGLTFHLLGDLREQVNWAAPNADFLEKRYDIRLQGYDDRAKLVEVVLPDGETVRELQRDYSELLPLWWARRNPDAPEVRAVLERERDLHLSLDAALQVATRAALQDALDEAAQAHPEARSSRAAAVVLDVGSGAVLAQVSLPAPEHLGSALRRYAPDAPELFDRPRFGLYPPGSTFKLVTALAALKKDPALATRRYGCVALGDGRIGAYVAGKRRPVRDDVLDRRPHGQVEIIQGLEVSCNAYFAQLAVDVVGPVAMREMAGHFGIDVANPNTVARLRPVLEQAAFGQGQVTAHPVQLAEVMATVAGGGTLVRAVLLKEDEDVNRRLWSSPEWQRAKLEPGAITAGMPLVDPDGALLIQRGLRQAVLVGTGRGIRESGEELPMAGKTGTAEVEGARSHAWFVGSAPYLEPGESIAALSDSEASVGGSVPVVAVAVLLENTGYGGRFAAPAARAIVNAAQALGLAGAPVPETGAAGPEAAEARAAIPDVVSEQNLSKTSPAGAGREAHRRP